MKLSNAIVRDGRCGCYWSCVLCVMFVMCHFRYVSLSSCVTFVMCHCHRVLLSSCVIVIVYHL